MKEMTFKHNYARRESLHRVVYIEYHGKNVHAVITDEKEEDNKKWDGYCNYFDFEVDCKKIERFMFYHSGAGGKITEIQAPTYVKGASDVFYWMHPDAKFKGKPQNIKRLKTPIKINGTANPFKRGREIYGQTYCKVCNMYYDEDLCPEHHSLNENDEIVYPDGTIED